MAGSAIEAMSTMALMTCGVTARAPGHGPRRPLLPGIDAERVERRFDRAGGTHFDRRLHASNVLSRQEGNGRDSDMQGDTSWCADRGLIQDQLGVELRLVQDYDQRVLEAHSHLSMIRDVYLFLSTFNEKDILNNLLKMSKVEE